MADSELTFESEQCKICLEDIENQEVAIPETCNHKFCLACLSRWGRNNNDCPYCRRNFNEIKVYVFNNGVYRIQETRSLVEENDDGNNANNNNNSDLIDDEFAREELTVRFMLAHEIYRFRSDEISMRRPLRINVLPNVSPRIIIDEDIMIRLRNIINSRIEFILRKYRNFAIPGRNTQIDEEDWIRDHVYPHIEDQLAAFRERVVTDFRFPMSLYVEFMSRKRRYQLRQV